MKFIMDFGTNMVTTQDLGTDRGQESWSSGIVVWNRGLESWSGIVTAVMVLQHSLFGQL